MNAEERGFTLLEVLVALVILIGGLVALYQAFGVSLFSSSAADQERRATGAAEQLLAELGRSRPLEDGVTTGVLANGQSFTLRLEPFTAVEDHGSPSPVAGHLATLDIAPTQDRDRKLRVRTLLLGIPQ
jgi:prepilin-type N-terminal cleavage/methylation domain-containing protein